MGFQGKGSNQKQVSTLVYVFWGSHKFCFFQPVLQIRPGAFVAAAWSFYFLRTPKEKAYVSRAEIKKWSRSEFCRGAGLDGHFRAKISPANKPALLYSLAGGEGCVFGSPLRGFIGTYLWLLFWMNDAMSASSFVGVCRLYAVCLIRGLSTVYGMLHV